MKEDNTDAAVILIQGDFAYSFRVNGDDFLNDNLDDIVLNEVEDSRCEVIIDYDVCPPDCENSRVLEAKITGEIYNKLFYELQFHEKY